MMELPLSERKRLLKTAPSPGGSGEFETSPLLGFTCGARPRCTRSTQIAHFVGNFAYPPGVM